MEFDSLHSYLEYCFSDKGAVTESMIKHAKEKYRRLYLSNYYHKYQKKHVQISFRLSKKQYAKIEKQATLENQKLTFYIKQLVLNSGNSHFEQKAIYHFTIQAIDLVEESIQEQIPLDAKELLLLLKQTQKELQ